MVDRAMVWYFTKGKTKMNKTLDKVSESFKVTIIAMAIAMCAVMVEGAEAETLKHITSIFFVSLGVDISNMIIRAIDKKTKGRRQ